MSSSPRAKTVVSLVLAAALVSGCAGPRPAIPASAGVKPPAHWRGDPGPAHDVEPGWWKSLDDPVVDQLVERAVANNTDVLIAARRVEEADARVRLARSATLPHLNFTGKGVPRERSYSTVTGKAIEFTAYEVELGASYDADLFGRLRNQTAAARATLLATKAAADGVRLATIAAVVEHYVALRGLDADLAIAQETQKMRAEELALLQHQLRAGYVFHVAVDEASAQVHVVAQQVAQLQLGIAREEESISLLLGDNPQAIARGRALAELPLIVTPSSLPARLLRRRPDVYEAEQTVVAADHELDSARAAFMPDLQLAATGGRLDADLLPGALSIFSFTGTVLAPIFEGGRLRANQTMAAAQRDQAAFAYRRTALAAFGEVEDAFAAVQRLGEKERAASAQSDDEAQALKAAHRRFARGYSSYQEVLDAERGLLSAQLTMVDVRADRLTALVKLYQAMGGGWPG